MCRWMGSHLHDWIDYNGVAFSLELLEWDPTFLRFGGSENSGRLFRFLGKLPTYPSPNSTLTFASHLGKNVGFREG